jgi:hypothetical protein
MQMMLSMKEAPRDGTIIIAFYTDFSGCCLIRWGQDNRDPSIEKWFQADFGDDTFDVWLGWIPCPPVNLDLILDQRKKEKEEA